MSASLEMSRICNDRAKEAEKNYPGRFIAAPTRIRSAGPEP